MEIFPISSLPKEKIIHFFRQHWGSPEMVISSGIYDCSKLEGFTVVTHNELLGLITYIMKEKECEIISLDSTVEGKGIGSLLVKNVEELAIKQNCKRIRLITTNDNLSALRFYQKRGYLLYEVLRNAVEKARKIKPEIPLFGNDGIPIRDEIVLEKQLN